MSQGQTLATLVRRVKTLCGDSTQEGSAVNQDIASLLGMTQESLANTADWASLETIEDVVVNASERVGTLPSLNLARPVLVEYRWSELWHPLCYGIGSEEYNAWDAGEAAEPVQRWKILPMGDVAERTFEIWPTPNNNATVRFTGQRALLPFEADEDICTLDGLMLAYYAAAERLTVLNKKSASMMLSKANALAATLKAVEHRQNNVFSFTKYSDEDQQTRKKFVPILSV